MTVYVMLRTLALLGVLTLVLGACGDDPDVPEAGPDPGEDPAPLETGDEAPAQVEGSATVAVGSSELGDILVDGAGMTLYMFQPDEQSRPTCYDDCADAWPPLLADGDAMAGAGADQALLGTVQRDDGPTQVTYNGWPLYHWAGDDAPGDANGQGINDVWWVIAPDGTPVRGG